MLIKENVSCAEKDPSIFFFSPKRIDPSKPPLPDAMLLYAKEYMSHCKSIHYLRATIIYYKIIFDDMIDFKINKLNCSCI